MAFPLRRGDRFKLFKMYLPIDCPERRRSPENGANLRRSWLARTVEDRRESSHVRW